MTDSRSGWLMFSCYQEISTLCLEKFAKLKSACDLIYQILCSGSLSTTSNSECFPTHRQPPRLCRWQMPRCLDTVTTASSEPWFHDLIINLFSSETICERPYSQQCSSSTNTVICKQVQTLFPPSRLSEVRQCSTVTMWYELMHWERNPGHNLADAGENNGYCAGQAGTVGLVRLSIWNR